MQYAHKTYILSMVKLKLLAHNILGSIPGLVTVFHVVCFCVGSFHHVQRFVTMTNVLLYIACRCE